MVRISAIFIAVCMALIAVSVGFVVYLRFGLTGAESFLIGLGMLTALAVYNAIAARNRDRSEVSDQIATVSRGSADLARQLAEFGLKLSTIETKVETVLDKALTTAQPLAAEIEELSTLVKRLADQVATHEAALSADIGKERAAPMAPAAAVAAAAAPQAPPATAADSAAAAFFGLDQDGIIATISSAIDGNKIDLYLQPIVTLPQRKVRYYEALSRLKTDGGELIAAGDFLKFAEAGALMPKLDRLSVLRCVQLVRRLLLKNRDIGLFCNLAAATLTDAGFPQLLEFIEANRAIAPALVFEFTQSAFRAMGPIEHEALAAIAERGFRFSIDNLADLRVEPRELTERGFRFVKVPATLLLNRVGAASTDIRPADLSDLLGRFGIDLIAEKIEAEGAVVDLLDYDVRFGQGFLFSPPRPVRAEALQGVELAKADAAKTEAAEAGKRSAKPGGILAQLVRASVGRS
jgi:cyclic-di-GMP phosphodiesterase, flagellum assembly factor TipF